MWDCGTNQLFVGRMSHGLKQSFFGAFQTRVGLWDIFIHFPYRKKIFILIDCLNLTIKTKYYYIYKVYMGGICPTVPQPFETKLFRYFANAACTTFP